jgi:hypothetical protein
MIKVNMTYCAKRIAKKGNDVRILFHGIGGDVILPEPHN